MSIFTKNNIVREKKGLTVVKVIGSGLDIHTFCGEVIYSTNKYDIGRRTYEFKKKDYCQKKQ